ncbi:adenylate kinase [Amaricoccus tamworthensis]|uniref:adenylate kinase n=1 Tax=Amaricoccus tamworthensis TaxID=57002 RepID=UPI003C7EB0E2
MVTRRIHVTGASGAGVTTLGRALATRFAIPHHDTDDYFWKPTNPPYRDRRPIHDRLRLMNEIFLDRPAWVLSGALESWGNSLVPYFDLVVFVRTEGNVRMKRLLHREAKRLGIRREQLLDEAGSDVLSFLKWADNYETGGLSRRSLHRHEIWLGSLNCPVVKVDGDQPVARLVTTVEHALDG